VLHKLLLSLHATVRNLTHFFRVKSFPGACVQVDEERHNKYRVREVDERVSHVAVVLEVNGKVEEVPRPCMMAIDAFKQHLLRVLVWYVPNHDSRALVEAGQDLIQIHDKRGVPYVL
jgi:hypothetical protein